MVVRTECVSRVHLRYVLNSKPHAFTYNIRPDGGIVVKLTRFTHDLRKEHDMLKVPSAVRDVSQLADCAPENSAM
jgi:hypothetical protein